MSQEEIEMLLNGSMAADTAPAPEPAPSPAAPQPAATVPKNNESDGEYRQFCDSADDEPDADAAANDKSDAADDSADAEFSDEYAEEGSSGTKNHQC